MNPAKIKSIIRYILADYKNGIIVMYLCVYVLIILTVLKTELSVFNGIELISLITLFCFGLTIFKENFYFLSANGISRKTQFVSTICSCFTMSAFFSFIDTINSVILTKSAPYHSMFAAIYAPRTEQAAAGGFGSMLCLLLENFLFLTVLYFCVMLIGYFLTNLYYKMNRGWKIGVSVGVPVVLGNGIPWLNTYVFHGELGAVFLRFNAAMWGISYGYNPFVAMGSLLLISLLFSALTFLLMRRAVIKK